MENKLAGLADGEDIFTRVLQEELPAQSGVKVSIVPVFGPPGSGRTTVVNAMVDLVVEKHGRESVNVRVGTSLVALSESMDARPVQVLVWDDVVGGAGRLASSEGGAWMRVRQALHRICPHGRGLIYLFLTAERFLAVDMMFRGGLVVCTGGERTDDEWQQLTAYWRASMGRWVDIIVDEEGQAVEDVVVAAAANLLRRVGAGDRKGLGNVVVTVPGRGPMRVWLPFQRPYYLGEANRVLLGINSPNSAV